MNLSIVSDINQQIEQTALTLEPGYVSDTLVDAQEYCTYAGKSVIDDDDVRLAIQSRLNHHYSPPPSRDLWLELAEKLNVIPLPPIPGEYGVHLPAPQFQLSSDNILVQHLPENGVPSAAAAAATATTTTSGTTNVPGAKGGGSRNKTLAKTPIPIKLDGTKRKLDQVSN